MKMRGSAQGLAGRSGRTSAVCCLAKLKIAQNHNRAKRVPVEIDPNQLYASSTFLPAAQFGPIKAKNIPGKGRALVATSPINPGDLLLISEPLGQVVRGPEGASLQPQHLVPVLTAAGALSPRDRQRAALLYDGTAASATHDLTLEDLAPVPPSPDADAVEEDSTRASDVRKKLKAAQASAKASAKGFGAKSPSPPSTNPAAAPSPSTSSAKDVTDEELAAVVRYNSWGVEYADPGVAAVRGEPSHSYIGVWPEFSLMNHSCVPNTVIMLVGDRLLVRAAAPIPAEGEVTTSYLGNHGGAPLSERRNVLQTTYGFKCGCPRCEVEEQAGEEVAGLLEDMWGWFEKGGLLDRVRTQVAVRDPALVALRTQLSGHLNRLEQLLSSGKVPSQLRNWVRASAYGCYELLAVCKDVHVLEVAAPDASGVSTPQVATPTSTAVPTAPSGSAKGRKGKAQEAAAAAAAAEAAEEDDRTDETLPAELVPLIQVFAPASDAHLYLTLEWLSRVGAKHGTGHADTQEAAKACLASHLVRYGRVPDAMLTKLMTERTKVDSYMGRINLPTPFAASPAAVAAMSAVSTPPGPPAAKRPVAA